LLEGDRKLILSPTITGIGSQLLSFMSVGAVAPGAAALYSALTVLMEMCQCADWDIGVLMEMCQCADWDIRAVGGNSELLSSEEQLWWPG
jgi:hypothetical protein